jgi:hypothetical protein
VTSPFVAGVTSLTVAVGVGFAEGVGVTSVGVAEGVGFAEATTALALLSGD